MKSLTKNIVPISDLQRQAGKVVEKLSTSDDPIIITQNGRAAAVMISPGEYERMQEDLELIDDIELMRLLKEAEKAKAAGKTISHKEVKKRLKITKKQNA